MNHTDPIAALTRAYHAALTEALLSGSTYHVNRAADTLRRLGVRIGEGEEKTVGYWAVAAACAPERACWEAVDTLWGIEHDATLVRRPAPAATLWTRIFGGGER